MRTERMMIMVMGVVSLMMGGCQCIDTASDTDSDIHSSPFVTPVQNFGWDVESVMQHRLTHAEKAFMVAILSDDINNEVDYLRKSLLVALHVLGPHVILAGYVNASMHMNVTLKNNSFIPLNGENALYVFDNPVNLTSYDVVPFKNWTTTKNLRMWLEKRYMMSLEFTSDLAVDLRWAHARGNFRLAPLGREGTSLHIGPNSSAVQYTTAGHLFVALPLETTSIEFPVSEIISFFVVPATTIKLSLPHTSINMMRTGIETYGISNSILAFRVHHCLSLGVVNHRGETRNGGSNCEQFLFDYWRRQRQSHLWVQPWALKALQANKHAPQWHVFTLPAALYSRIADSYLRSRASNSKTEPLISTVFNQLEAPTYHIPIDESTLRELSNAVMAETAMWLSIPVEGLVNTGAYGIREYRKGAVINWHTDPARMQPLTAIVHIGNSHFSAITRSNSSTADSAATAVEWMFELASNVDVEVLLSEASLQTTQVALHPGQALILESARIPHARQRSLSSDWYGNAFVHLAPKNWVSYIDHIL